MEELPDESTEFKNSKLQCPCRIGLKFREESWHVQKLDLTHKGHKLLSARAVAREERCIKPDWAAMIKDHGALGLSPSTCLELLEKHFGDAFRNATNNLFVHVVVNGWVSHAATILRSCSEERYPCISTSLCSMSNGLSNNLLLLPKCPWSNHPSPQRQLRSFLSL